MFAAVKEDTGQDHPALKTKPALRSDCIKYLDVFRLLSACRLWGEAGPQPLQLGEIRAALDLHGLEEAATKVKYARLLKLMDSVELTHLRSQK